jgi:hypothetical protein
MGGKIGREHPYQQTTETAEWLEPGTKQRLGNLSHELVNISSVLDLLDYRFEDLMWGDRLHKDSRYETIYKSGAMGLLSILNHALKEVSEEMSNIV